MDDKNKQTDSVEQNATTEVNNNVIEQQPTAQNSTDQTNSVQNETASNTNNTMQSQIIGELPVEQQKGIFWMFLFFGILIGLVFGLPYITDYIEEKNEQKNKEQEVVPQEKSEAQPEATPEVIYREIDMNTVFSIDELQFKQLSKEIVEGEYYLKLTITNNGKITYNFDQPKYFIELFNQDKTLIERSKLISDSSIASGETVDITLLISENAYNNSTLITVVQKDVKDYPEYELSKNIDDKKLMVCTNNNSSISYYFDQKNRLIEINDIYNYNLIDGQIELYNDRLNAYQNKSAELKNNEGVTSAIADTDSSFTVNTQIDLSKANINNLKDNHYFAKDTEPKVVKFEMESMRYTCE